MPVFQEIDDEDEAERVEAMLPDYSLEKVEHLESIWAARHARVSVAFEKRKGLYDKKHEYESYIARTKRAIESEGAYPTADSDALVTKLSRRIVKIEQEARRLGDETKLEPTLTMDVVYEAARDAVNAGSSFADGRVSVKLGKSEGIIDKINASRKVIAALISKRGAVRNALLPKEVALHRAINDLKVSAVIPDFTPNTRLIRPMGNVRPRQGETKWPMLSVETGTRLVELEDAAGIVKFVMQDALIAAATEAISKLYEGNPLVVAESERDARMAEIDELILAESRVEEALIEIAEGKGLNVLRRPNAPPFAVLGVAVDSDAKDFG